ncbi:uncharacterized protein LOC143231496 [Tachypleus tridentatus]|uniref:uncharacterized protein LOC143231496 n=1 Tax=Tachypleus tridentatus TaxID=6853 RepID=UPI003FD4DFB4
MKFLLFYAVAVTVGVIVTGIDFQIPEDSFLDFYSYNNRRNFPTRNYYFTRPGQSYGFGYDYDGSRYAFRGNYGNIPNRRYDYTQGYPYYFYDTNYGYNHGYGFGFGYN